MCKSEMVRQKHPSWGNSPPAFPAQPRHPNPPRLWLQLQGGASLLLTSPGLCSRLQLRLIHPAFGELVLRGAEEFFALVSGEFFIQLLKMFYLLSDGDVKVWSLSYGFA